MSVFKGIEHVSAEGTSNRQYFEEGNYIVEIDKVLLHEKILNGSKLFIVETTIIESDNPNIKPGEQRNWVHSLALRSPLPAIKSFIGAAIGLCPRRHFDDFNTKVNEEFSLHVISPANPLRGRKVALSVKDRNGKKFPKVTWRIYE